MESVLPHISKTSLVGYTLLETSDFLDDLEKYLANNSLTLDDENLLANKSFFQTAFHETDGKTNGTAHLHSEMLDPAFLNLIITLIYQIQIKKALPVRVYPREGFLKSNGGG